MWRHMLPSYASAEACLTGWSNAQPQRRDKYNLWLAVWLSGNTLASINVVALRQTRLVLGWVTVCGRVNHLGM